MKWPLTLCKVGFYFFINFAYFLVSRKLTACENLHCHQRLAVRSLLPLPDICSPLPRISDNLVPLPNIRGHYRNRSSPFYLSPSVFAEMRSLIIPPHYEIYFQTMFLRLLGSQPFQLLAFT